MRRLLYVLAFMTIGHVAHGGVTDTSYKYWLTFGGWVENRKVSLELQYSLSLVGHFCNVGYFTRGGFSESPTPGKDGYLFHAVNASFGERLHFRWFQGSVFAGPSFVWGEKRVSLQSSERFHTIGLDTRLQMLFRPADEVGIGVGLYGNLNPEHSFGGININLTLGNGI